MTEKELRDLEVGDIVRNKSGSEGYVITGSYGNRAIGVRTIDITNPSEWDRVVIKSTGEWRME